MINVKNLHPSPTCEVSCDGVTFYLPTSGVIKWLVDKVPAREVFHNLSSRELEILENTN